MFIIENSDVVSDAQILFMTVTSVRFGQGQINNTSTMPINWRTSLFMTQDTEQLVTTLVYIVAALQLNVKPWLLQSSIVAIAGVKSLVTPTESFQHMHHLTIFPWVNVSSFITHLCRQEFFSSKSSNHLSLGGLFLFLIYTYAIRIFFQHII